jgi:7-carboxy-7-deazaguanine synthase
MTVDEVADRVEKLASTGTGAGESSGKAKAARGVSLVELTGGEPMMQPEIIPLAQKLLDSGYTVMIETSGERPVVDLPREVIKIVDVKCPDSGAADTFQFDNLNWLDEKDEIKFVISSRRDYEFARDFTFRYDLARRVHQVLLSPVHADPEGKWPGINAQKVAEWILADGLPVRLALQLHKFIWHPATRGV